MPIVLIASIPQGPGFKPRSVHLFGPAAPAAPAAPAVTPALLSAPLIHLYIQVIPTHNLGKNANTLSWSSPCCSS